MRISPEPLAIKDDDGFDTSDIFDARQAGERLANLVGILDDHAVIALDGAWGTGKSVFVQQWAGLMRQRHHRVVYFDAFAHDHLDDAFFPLLSQLIKATDSGYHNCKNERIHDATRKLIRAMPKLATDLALSKFLGIRMRDIKKAMNGSLDKMIKDRIHGMQTQMSYVTNFRNVLSGAIAYSANDETKAPLIFIIDELDRCRPSYALSILERIKHVFAINGVCFVLVAHLKNLAMMVGKMYGYDDHNSMRYLEKFWYLRVEVDAMLAITANSARTRYLGHLFEKYKIIPQNPAFIPNGINQDAASIIKNLINVHRVSLRDIERMVFHYHLVQNAIIAHGKMHRSRKLELIRFVLPVLPVLRHLRHDLYQSATVGNLKWKAILDFLSLQQWDPIANTGDVERTWEQVMGDQKELVQACRAMDMFADFASI